MCIFIRYKYVEYTLKNAIEFSTHDYYLLQSYVSYLIYIGIFFWNVIYYSELRNDLIKIIQSSSFVNKFLTRWSTQKIQTKCRDENPAIQLNKMLICIEQENATSIDWIVLDKLTTDKWMDFSILGISTQDGSLIKKVFTFSSIIYFVISYL